MKNNSLTSLLWNYCPRSIKLEGEDSDSPILCGHPKKILDEDGIDFFEQVLNPEEWIWLAKVTKAAYSVFFETPLRVRKKLTFSYELAFSTADKNRVILHNKLMPYLLCENENMLLSLCSVAKSRQEKSGQTALINNHTGDRYRFVNNKFERVNPIDLTKEDLLLLELMVKGFNLERMTSQLKSSYSSVKRKRASLFEKIGVSNDAGAVHWAFLEGIF